MEVTDRVILFPPTKRIEQMVDLVAVTIIKGPLMEVLEKQMLSNQLWVKVLVMAVTFGPPQWEAVAVALMGVVVLQLCWKYQKPSRTMVNLSRKDK